MGSSWDRITPDSTAETFLFFTHQCYITVVLMTARYWTEQGCTSTDELVTEIWHIYKADYHSAIKKNEMWGSG